jgi:hypothetical protein
MLCLWSILNSANLLRRFPSSADLLAFLVHHYVKNAEDKEAIEQQVRRIEGVQGLTNRLQVAGQ